MLLTSPYMLQAVPHSRRDTDSYNDETFGSSEYTSEDRAEEERKRRGKDSYIKIFGCNTFYHFLGFIYF